MNYRMLNQALLGISPQISIEITQDTCTYKGTATHYSPKTNCDNGQNVMVF